MIKMGAATNIFFEQKVMQARFHFSFLQNVLFYLCLADTVVTCVGFLSLKK